MTPELSNLTKNLNCSKTGLVMQKIFSEHLKMIISKYPFDFQKQRIIVHQKFFALNPVFCVCQNNISELLGMIMLQNIGEAVLHLISFISNDLF